MVAIRMVWLWSSSSAPYTAEEAITVWIPSLKNR